MKMRNLIIDIGNTRAKMGVYEGSRLVGSVMALAHDELAEAAMRLCGELGIRQGMYASVAADDDVTVRPLMDSGVEMKELTAKCELPFEICYGTPGTLGADRIAAVAGAISEMGRREMMIVDAGTAITYEYIDKEGRYAGGAISPGTEMRYKALKTFTGRLPKASDEDYRGMVGKTTLECMASGVKEGVMYEIEGRIREFRNGDDKKVVLLTGGDNKYLLERVKSNIFARPNLVLDGIASICASMR